MQLLFITFFSLVYAQEVDDLVYMTKIMPANYLEKGKLRVKKMGYTEQKIKVLPWARGYSHVMKQKNHVLFSMARTKDREKLFQWAGPICTSRLVLIALADNKIKLSKFEDVKKYNTGYCRSDFEKIRLCQKTTKRFQTETKHTKT